MGKCPVIVCGLVKMFLMSHQRFFQLVHEGITFQMDPAVSICSRTIIMFRLQLFLQSANQLQAKTATPTQTAGCTSFSASVTDGAS